MHVTAYTLPPDKYAKARNLSRIGYFTRVVEPLYSILVLYWLLRWCWTAKFRDWAERLSSRRLVQAVIFSAAFFAVLAIFDLPFEIAEHWLYRRYDLVVQGWGSWLGDQGKGLLVNVVIGFIFVAIFFAVVRRTQRWWLYFWLASIPILIFLIFLTPMVIDPLFNKFEPLAAHEPQLVADLERVVYRAGMEIPPERMYLMKASEKVKLRERLRYRAGGFEARGGVGHDDRQNDPAADSLRVRARDGALRFESRLQRAGAGDVAASGFVLSCGADFAAVAGEAFRGAENSRARRLGCVAGVLDSGADHFVCGHADNECRVALF